MVLIKELKNYLNNKKFKLKKYIFKLYRQQNI